MGSVETASSFHEYDQQLIGEYKKIDDAHGASEVQIGTEGGDSAGHVGAPVQLTLVNLLMFSFELATLELRFDICSFGDHQRYETQPSPLKLLVPYNCQELPAGIWSMTAVKGAGLQGLSFGLPAGLQAFSASGENTLPFAASVYEVSNWVQSTLSALNKKNALAAEQIDVSQLGCLTSRAYIRG
ncbi:MAG: hypothetical protein FRX49_03504 [Trebouxia sp. A1-2]|nr:MAG: hypothetical protein FRX49_03504 [Trebouxia sp. A1-2]